MIYCIQLIPDIRKGAVSEQFCSDQMVSCNGFIEKVFDNGKLVDCKCINCNYSYGKNYLDRERILESFVSV